MSRPAKDPVTIVYPDAEEVPGWIAHKITNCDFIVHKITNCELMTSGENKGKWCYTVEWEPTTLGPARDMERSYPAQLYHYLNPDKPAPPTFKLPRQFKPEPEDDPHHSEDEASFLQGEIQDLRDTLARSHLQERAKVKEIEELKSKLAAWEATDAKLEACAKGEPIVTTTRTHDQTKPVSREEKPSGRAHNAADNKVRAKDSFEDGAFMSYSFGNKATTSMRSCHVRLWKMDASSKTHDSIFLRPCDTKHPSQSEVWRVPLYGKQPIVVARKAVAPSSFPATDCAWAIHLSTMCPDPDDDDDIFLTADQRTLMHWQSELSLIHAKLRLRC